MLALQSNNVQTVRISISRTVSICTSVSAQIAGSACNILGQTQMEPTSTSLTATSERHMAIRCSQSILQYTTLSPARSHPRLAYSSCAIQTRRLLSHFVNGSLARHRVSVGLPLPLWQKGLSKRHQCFLTTVGFEPTRFYPQVGLQQERMLQVNLKLAP